jgi:hypothetical protein
MTTFKDTAGRDWSLRITVGSLPKLRETGLDLNKVRQGDGSGFEALGDPETLGRLVWLLCKSQAEAANVSEEQFTEALDGPTVADATQALLGAIVDFTRRPEVAKAMKAKLPAVMEKQDRTAIKMIEALSVSDGDLPPSPASTPPTAPSAN